MNTVILTGRVTKDIEARDTSTGRKVASFTIAVDRRTKDGKATVRWTAVDGVDGYQIAYKDGQTGKNVLMGELKPGEELLAKDGYLDYTVRFWDSEHFLESLERLNQRDDVIKAELIYTTEDDPNLMGIDERGNFYAAGDLLIDGNFYIKTADYKNGGELNGIPVTSIFCLYAKDDYHSYVIRMDNTVDLKEAADAFAQIEGVDDVIYNHFSFPDEWLGTRNVADVDDDGDIDSMDYVLLKRAYFGTYDIHGNQLVRCDVNRDDLIDSMDYILAKRIYFGTYSAE